MKHANIWVDAAGKKYKAIIPWEYIHTDAYFCEVGYPTPESKAFIPIPKEVYHCQLIPIDTPVFTVSCEVLPENPFSWLSEKSQERVRAMLGNNATHYNTTIEQHYNSYVKQHEGCEYMNECDWCWCEELDHLTVDKGGVI